MRLRPYSSWNKEVERLWSYPQNFAGPEARASNYHFDTPRFSLFTLGGCEVGKHFEFINRKIPSCHWLRMWSMKLWSYPVVKELSTHVSLLDFVLYYLHCSLCLSVLSIIISCSRSHSTMPKEPTGHVWETCCRGAIRSIVNHIYVIQTPFIVYLL